MKNLSESSKTTANRLRREPTAPELTEDLVLEIVKRLPLRNALQLSSVNKYFKRYITGPTFGREHALLSSSSPSGRIIIFHCSATGPMIYTTLVSPTVPQSMILETRLSILASCNGVLLLRLSYSHHFVFNPTTGGNMFLDYPFYSHRDVGLAVDFPAGSPSTFKLVMVDNIQTWSRYQTLLRFTVVVPSAAAAGSKTVVVKSKVEFHCKGTLFKRMPDPNIRPVYAHGRLHWLRDDAAQIVAFDVEKEEATIITGPIKRWGYCGFKKRVDKWFGFAEESLHFIYALPEEIVIHTHDYGNDEWRVAHRIRNISERPTNDMLRDGVPVMFDGEHVFLQLRPMLEGGCVWMYDLKSGNWEKTSGKVGGWADWKQNFFAYLPTLANVSYGKDLQGIIEECPLQDKEQLSLYYAFKVSLLRLQHLLR